MGRINTKSKKTKEISTKSNNDTEVIVKKKLIGKLDLKNTSRSKHKSSTITKLKKNEELKSNLLKQINLSEKQVDSSTTKTNDLNFVKRPQAPTRLTNTALKQIINQANELTKKNDPKLDRLKKTLKKSVKSKIKKDTWLKNIESIKDQIKEKHAKQKREKTVIVGDMQPMIESLLTTSSNADQVVENNKLPTLLPQVNTKHKKVTFNDDALSELTKIKEKNSKAMSTIKSTREENFAKLREKEMNKSIPRQSIRSKKSQEDLALFNELSVHKEFVNNPLEIIKKHLK